MTLVSRLLGKLLKLPPAETYDVQVERDVQVPMQDGIVLLADHYSPRTLPQRPTVLVRSPYGRAGFFGLLFGRFIAERGFQVLVQSCRGTFGSGGTFNPFHQERADGLATVEWLKKQSWFNGELATVGPSYLGYVQWAIAGEVGSPLKAMSTWITSAEFRSVTYPGDALYLESALGWTTMMHQQENRRFGLLSAAFASDKKLQQAYHHLPLAQSDTVSLGKRVPFWQDWMEHAQPGDEWWADSDFSQSVGTVTAPNHIIGGWYDLFLPHTFRDYKSLKDSGREPYLTIGPWAHTDMGSMSLALGETIAWLRAHLLNERGKLRAAPVRIFVMGANEWRDLPAWPPENIHTQRWHLQPNGNFALETPPQSEPDHYRYDPSHPTPNIGGAGMGKINGPRDNRPLEARSDVLTYTSAPLEHDLEVIGAVTAELYVKSSVEHTDFFARLCDVDTNGKSTNICDGLIRLFPGKVPKEADGSLRVHLDLWPTAYRFKAGHQIRVQVSSGAFPRWARNTGSGEPLGTATTLIAANQTIYHDPEHPSAILLSVMK
jgi:putative CocE/NonD family hydrolase